MQKITLFIQVILLLLGFTLKAQVGINIEQPNDGAMLDINASDKGLIIPRVDITDLSTIAPITGGSTESLLVYNINDTTGKGFYYWNTMRWVPLSNDTNLYTKDGTLASDRTISFDGQDLIFDNINSDFIINNGNTENEYIRNQILFSSGETATGIDYRHSISTRHHPFADARNDRNAFDFFLWNANDDSTTEIGSQLAFTLAGNRTHFNVGNYDTDFLIESVNNTFALFLDADEDAVIFGSTGQLQDDGASFITVNLDPIDQYITSVDYVADFDNGTSRGTTMGLGSVEYLVDGEAELFISDSFSPTTDLTSDLGAGNAWRNVFAEDFITVSDITAKHNIERMPYGLNEILKLNTITYKLKNDPNQQQRIGVIAQEVKEHIKEASKSEIFKKQEDGTFKKKNLDKIHVSYISLIPVLIEATKDQQVIIEEQGTQIKKQEKLIEMLMKRVDQLEK